MQKTVISPDLIAQGNADNAAALEDDYASLDRKLERRGIAIDSVKDRAKGWSVAVPSWGAGRGGTRFAKFPLAGEPTNIHEKLEDCAVIHQLGRTTPRVSPHFPWDCVEDYAGLREEAESYGLGFDAVNSNTFQDQPGQAQTYATGSLASTVEATRQQAVEHNIECIEIGQKIGSRRLTVWVGDGTNFPGQQDLGRSLDRYLEAAAQVYAALPGDWQMMLEHKMFVAGLLLLGHFGLGQFADGGAGTWRQVQVPCRSWPPRPEREYRTDRRPSSPRGKARRLPFQRQQVWRRRSRQRID
ncbi:hypothetical protein [Croceicoccus sp. YJ47]|uniref:hypothetical protein n=1 Tax=Croceicoccus sp. YJ47 TaxID=2798724 RepID=UPI001F1E0E23|nr:hypothetical protein [Croceicoccus sp. YJ47]